MQQRTLLNPLQMLLLSANQVEELLLADDAILVDVELYEELVDLWGRGEGLSGQK